MGETMTLNRICYALCAGTVLYLSYHLVLWHRAGFAVVGQ